MDIKPAWLLEGLFMTLAWRTHADGELNPQSLHITTNLQTSNNLQRGKEKCPK